MKGQRLRQRELHEQELPVANLTALMANLNRDSKKVRTPYKLTDFCFYAEEADKNNPDAAPAAAYMHLIETSQLPSWALFVFSDMKGTHKPGTSTPEPVAAIGDGFILLAPEPRNGGIEGLMLATSSVAGKEIEVKIAGMTARIQVPNFEGSVVAREHVYVAAA